MPDDAVWTVLMCRNVEAAKSFYAAALGWSFEPCASASLPCWVARGQAGRPIAMFVDTAKSGFPDAPEIWMPCIAVEDLDRRVHEAEEQGATLLRPPFDFAAFGRVAIIRQPGGGLAGWVDSAKMPAA